MDYDSPEFIAAVKKIASAPLTAIADALRAIADGLQQQNAAIKKASDSYQENQHSPSLRAELYVPPSDRYKQEANATRQSIAGVPTIFLEIFGFIVLIAYTTFAAFQWREMRKATKASAEASETAIVALDENKWQFRQTLKEIERQTKAQQDAADAAKSSADSAVADQRPYVVVKVPGVLTGGLVENTALTSTVTIANVGRTPATYSYDIVRLVHFPPPQFPPPGTLWLVPQKNFIDAEFNGIEAVEQRDRSVLTPLSGEDDIAPGGDYNSKTLPVFLRKTDIDDITTRDGWGGALFLFGLITYSDKDKHPYRTEFCWYTAGPDIDWKRCKFHNIIR